MLFNAGALTKAAPGGSEIIVAPNSFSGRADLFQIRLQMVVLSALRELIIAPTGKVVCAVFLSGPPASRSAVIEAVKQWEFKPASDLARVGVVSLNSN